MIFGKRLCEALEVIPLAQIDKRLDSDSEMTKISANLDQTRGPGRTRVQSLPPPVYTNFRRQKLPLSDSVIREAVQAPTAPATPQDDLEITAADLPPAETEAPPGMPSGSRYTLQQAKGQLDGIIKQWMDLAGNYPEGEQRHNFMEIGERLREISAVINRDFIQSGGKETPPEPPEAAPEAPEAAPEVPPAPQPQAQAGL